MSDDPYPTPPDPDQAYPVVRLLVRHGNAISVAIGVLIALAGVWGWFAGLGIFCVVAGVVAGAFVGFLTRSYVELARIITDLLLPR